MQVISEYFEEHHKRWNKIGHVCGFHVSSPVVKSPSSQSLKSTVITQQAISYLRFNRRRSSSSSFSSSQLGQAEFVYPSSQPYPNPTTRYSHMPRLHSGSSIPRPPSNLTQTDSNRPTAMAPSIPTYSDLSGEIGTADSLDSASSSSSSVTHYASWSKRIVDVCAEQTGSLKGEWNGGSGSEKGSREGSVDIVRPGSGKAQSRESQERKLVVRDSPDGGGGELSTEKVKASPRVSPRASPPRQSAAVRSRAKRTTFSSDV